MTTLINKIEGQWDNRGVAFYPGSNMYKLMSALVSEGDRQLEAADSISRANKIRTAEGPMLDKFGFAVNLPRETGESDDRYRIRIQLRYRLNSIEGTMDEIAQFMAAMVGVPVGQITLETRFDAAPATLYVSAQGSVWDQSILSRTEIEQFAGEVVSAGHRVILEETGSFQLTSDELLIEQGNIVEFGLTSDTIETGGTLAADIITDE